MIWVFLDFFFSDNFTKLLSGFSKLKWHCQLHFHVVPEELISEKEVNLNQ